MINPITKIYSEEYLFKQGFTEDDSHRILNESSVDKISSSSWQNISIPNDVIFKDKLESVLGSVAIDFIKKVVYISKQLGINYNWILAIINLESNFNPKIVGPSGTRGLIQWKNPSPNLPNTALGQLDYVYYWFKNKFSKQKPLTVIDCYLSVLYPKLMNKGLSEEFSDVSVRSNRKLFSFFPKDHKSFKTKANLVLTLSTNLLKDDPKFSIFSKLDKSFNDISSLQDFQKKYPNSSLV